MNKNIRRLKAFSKQAGPEVLGLFYCVNTTEYSITLQAKYNQSLAVWAAKNRFSFSKIDDGFVFFTRGIYTIILH
jgi:hypothetical protein